MALLDLQAMTQVLETDGGGGHSGTSKSCAESDLSVTLCHESDLSVLLCQN
ncbi:SapB/AmfS family lanthipeptide [Phytohabitans houttuyneae]|jgi:hypothetical protein|uniref:Lanthionine-containing peptide SapB n=1 Tax=Phytohabitans houttuyneae TaxID=1076126 RepID=A0A6V8JXC8_9ACTN|nr:SapB/AmfS family lanthipeptide [Phytohabitans houttuyneae]GFJ75930.1 hypothetical protein Phou_001100 [Phytohabitans houttuyneae]